MTWHLWVYLASVIQTLTVVSGTVVASVAVVALELYAVGDNDIDDDVVA